MYDTHTDRHEAGTLFSTGLNGKRTSAEGAEWGKRSGLTGTAAGPREEQKERNGRGGGGGEFSEFNVPSTTLGHLRQRI